MRVSVFGMGYVGAVTGACLAQMGHEVIGVDPSAVKLDLISSGKSPILEEGLNELLAEMVKLGRLKVKSSCDQAVAESDVSLICVGTPSLPNGALQTRFVERVSEEIGEALRSKNAYHSVVVRSTVLPGTTASLVVPALEKASGLKAGRDFGISMHPEFLREGTSIADFYNPPMTVIGSSSKSEFDKLCGLYEGALSVSGERLHCSVSTAEAMKYGCNIFHALKITFANEMGMFCKRAEVDAREVMEILCRDNKLNISDKYMKPGFAFGGSCLPKDLRACINFGKKADVAMPMAEGILSSNRLQIEQASERIMAFGKRRISLLGISFKEATDDLRESPLVHLAEILIGKGYDVRIYDPNVKYASIFGSNKDFIDIELPHLKSVLVESEQALCHAEVLVYGHNAETYRKTIPMITPDQIVLDLANITSVDCVAGKYEGLYW
ncbi:nucleotide sugar dehydrogenase [Aureliella helgolandensis]|uniref:UDP-glucose 6-dehydrogenase n=1 Tax=Aureliella helgolandensis TaxID=2527968 RepID=A0A518GFH5_9BACT|nr:nucleotide sugar dehydrogenase [Aureliella helgolandensis]QDV27318.1 GDP-mannose 6-dehydrogenase [Aureliella helgolandensis]